MNSNQIALLALAISLISIWLSYRTSRSSSLLAAAERRTEVRSLLVEALLEAQQLQRLVAGVLEQAKNEPKHKLSIPPRLDEIEGQLSQTVVLIVKAMNDFKSEQSNDPIQLEGFKSRALEGHTRIMQVSKLIKDLKISATDHNSA